MLYTGYTSNLEVRLNRHNSGGNFSTKHRVPLIPIFAEYYIFEEDARRREGYFKTTMGKKAIRLMLKSSLLKLGYKANSMQALIIDHDSLDGTD